MVNDNCDVYLEGSLSAMPTISKYKISETEITISRRQHSTQAVEFYPVILNWQDAMHIINYGHLGMSIRIYGSLRIDQVIEIIADKVLFIGWSNTGAVVSMVKKMDQKNTSEFKENVCTIH